MISMEQRRKLPKSEQGKILEYLEEKSFVQILIHGLAVYTSVVMLVSLIEIYSLYSIDTPLVQSQERNANWYEIIYFNIITILTVGYGDFSPVGFGRVLSSIEALIGVGLFAGLVSLLTIKALKPSSQSIVFSKYAYYCLDEGRFMVIFLNTGVNELENCAISSYFKLGQNWEVTPAVNPPFLTKAVQTFHVNIVDIERIKLELRHKDCLRLCVSGDLYGSPISATMQYDVDEIIVIPSRDPLTQYSGFWYPWDEKNDQVEFSNYFHYRPAESQSLAEYCDLNVSN